MKTVTITKAYLTSKDCSTEVLTDIATRHCKFSAEQVAKLGKQGKLLHNVVKYLQDANNGYAEMFGDGTLQLDVAVLQDDAKPQDRKPKAASGALTGTYVVTKKDGLKCTEANDPGKYAIWKFVFGCNSFEDYFNQAPKKAVTRTGRVITASSEMRWAVKCGWIKPTGSPAQVAETQQAAEQPQAQPA